MESRRIFIAVRPPEDIINSLVKTTRSYKKEPWGKDVRWVKSQNLHLTLKFIGQIENTLLDEVFSAVQSSIDCVEKFTLEMDGLKVFPKPLYPKIISAGIAENQKLFKLVTKIENELFKLKIPKEKRRFKGHITLGRCKKSFPKRQEIENHTENLKFSVNDVIIYQSVLKPEGAEYSIFKKIELC